MHEVVYKPSTHEIRGGGGGGNQFMHGNIFFMLESFYHSFFNHETVCTDGRRIMTEIFVKIYVLKEYGIC